MIEVKAESKIAEFSFYYVSKVLDTTFCSVANRIVFIDLFDMSFSAW